MNGVDNFVAQCKKILRNKVYLKEYMPEYKKYKPLDNSVIAQIKGETGVEPSEEILIYKPTGRIIEGQNERQKYYEYQYIKTITR